MRLPLRGELPESSGEAFEAAMDDSHIIGLINHCAEVIVWERTAQGLVAGLFAGWLIFGKILGH
jgi:hypothetical protein